MFRSILNLKYTTSDSENDSDYDPTQDPDYSSSSSEEEYDSSGDETICFQNIIDEKDREIEELKNVIKELRQMLKNKMEN